jgi:peptidoglycan/xylan/chitin deacetylase (PgdA/CDA1 family)
VRTGYRPLVLCYHAVTDRWRHELALPASTIVAQVERLLARGYRPATAADVVDGGGRLLHVTFDDAFRSILDVLPALERLNVPVTVFACTSYAETGAPLDVPELARDAAELPDELATMDWEQLRDLAARGVEIGSHTMTHPHLPRLTDEELERELRDSRAALEARLGRPCRFFAYPFGDEDERVREAVRSAGYEAAFAIKSDEQSVVRFALPRVCLFRSDNRLRAALKTRPLFRRFVRRLARA